MDYLYSKFFGKLANFTFKLSSIVNTACMKLAKEHLTIKFKKQDKLK